MRLSTAVVSSRRADTDGDGDGRIDAIEIDSDAGGISDLDESRGLFGNNASQIDNFFDNDGNGIDDRIQSLTIRIIDSDGDGFPDFQDQDSDNDGVIDQLESGSSDINANGIPDFQESPNGINEPELNALLTSGDNVQSGSSGCSIDTNHSKIDPLLPAQLLFAIAWLLRRRQIR